MKRIILLMIATVVVMSAQAQWDSKFYYPQKDIFKIDSLDYEASMRVAGADSLYVLRTVPKGKVKGSVFLYHGNSSNITSPLYQNIFRLLTDGGYQVFAFSYPGYGSSTGTPTHASIASAAAQLFEQWSAIPEVKGMPIALYGVSIGAQVASKLAADNQSSVSALVLDGSSPSFTSLAMLYMPKEHQKYAKQYVKSPYSVEQSVSQLKEVKVLFIHSQNDQIPYAEIKDLYDTKVSSYKEFWTYEGGHTEAAKLYPSMFVEKFNNILK